MLGRFLDVSTIDWSAQTTRMIYPLTAYIAEISSFEIIVGGLNFTREIPCHNSISTLDLRLSLLIISTGYTTLDRSRRFFLQQRSFNEHQTRRRKGLSKRPLKMRAHTNCHKASITESTVCSCLVSLGGISAVCQNFFSE